MSKIKTLFQLFIAMFKIGLFTFGGGYAMINILENEFVNKKAWIDGEEFLDLVAIAETTPGPIAINCATYIGYKKEKIIGAVCATLGMCIPSFLIIYFICAFFNNFLQIEWVNSAFKGIRVAVVMLILSAGFKMLKKAKKTVFNLSVIFVTAVSMLAFSLLSVSFSSIFYILFFGAVGILIYAVGCAKGKGKEHREDEK